MAEYAFDVNDINTVQSELIRGLSVSAEYKPIRRLTQRAEAAGLHILK
jgi:hypothetical protein